jgi:pseudouridine-5'-phosphate glycosidase
MTTASGELGITAVQVVCSSGKVPNELEVGTEMNEGLEVPGTSASCRETDRALLYLFCREKAIRAEREKANKRIKIEARRTWQLSDSLPLFLRFSEMKSVMQISP